MIEIIPVGIDRAAGRMLGRISCLVLPRRRRITADNLRRAFPEKDAAWHSRMTVKVFGNFGANLMEFIKFSAGRFSGSVEVSGMERLDPGVVLLTGHIGNWEITGMSVAAAGRELYPVGRRIHEPAFDRIVDELRTVYGSHHIPYRKSIREILSKIRDKKNICVLIDQRMKSGLPCRFFNRPVWATQIASVLHRKTGVGIVPGFSRHAGKKVRVFYGEPLDFVTEGDALRADFINTQRQMDWLEDRVREKPDEWFWMHNFWKDRWPAVFLDRDGTINEDKGYVSRIEDLKFIPGVMEAMRKLKKAGYLLVVVTNQSGIARGYYTVRDYNRLNEYFLKSLADEGVFIDRVYFCPHHPDDNCIDRKPNPGMVHSALKDLNIDLKRSFVIGDKASDIGLGRGLGIKTVMVMTGYGSDEIKKASPDYTADDLAAAAEIILGSRCGA
ncbi:MAG: D-glycero-beta-D-manno-heptose 1,7-bisphosphate 7-phosphatase [Elusimicrobia bacterium]|nr:D-glycero-beta-D-manno-heptose 1,7-bisphosphate 7-phosphatase [Elusimicrobiota bacterium]